MPGLGLGLGLNKTRRLLGDIPVLDLSFSASKSSVPSYGPTPTFTRASSGTYFDASGVLQTATTNNARFNNIYNGSSWVSRGLLVEEQRTNLVTYSEDISQAIGTASNFPKTANQIAAPDGNTTAGLIAENSATSLHQAFPSFSNSIATYCFSVFIKWKSGTTRNVSIIPHNNSSVGSSNGVIFDLNGSFVAYENGSSTAISGYGAVSVGNGWYWLWVTSPATASGTSFPTVRLKSGTTASHAGDGSSGVYVWGAQSEVGSLPSSYIKTTGASATRSADVCTISGSNFTGIWGSTEGSFAVEGISPATGTKALCSADGNSSANSIILSTSGTDPKFDVTTSSASQASINAGAVTANTAFKLSARYKVNDFAASIGGAAVVTGVSGTVPTVDRLRIGVDQAGNYLNGHISRLRYYNTRLDNTTLQTLST